MKKLLNTKIALSLYNLGGVLLLVLCLASCNNFLKADQVKNDIEAAIAYANAPSYTITVDYPGVSGVIKAPVGAQAVKKVTDTFALTFDAFADYEFICWKIINSADNKEIKNGDSVEIFTDGNMPEIIVGDVDGGHSFAAKVTYENRDK